MKGRVTSVEPAPIAAGEALRLAPAAFFAPAPAGHFWLEHLLHVLAAAPAGAYPDWELFTLPDAAGAEDFALLARNRQTGYALFHAVGAGGGLLLKGALEHCPPRKVLANHASFEAAVTEAGLRSRIVRDHRELFMLLPCGGLQVEPDGRYRLAAAQDIPRLEAWREGYMRERETEWHIDWRQAIAARSVYVRERDGVLTACLVKGAHLDTTVSFGGTYTFPRFRGEGEATMLVANFCAEMAREGLDVCLLVDDDNAPALRVYARVGFHPQGLYRTAYFA